VLAAILAGGAWLLLALAAFIAAGLHEFYGLARRTGAVVVAPIGYALAGIVLFLSPGAKLLADELGAIENAVPFKSWVIDTLEAGANRWEIAVTLTIMAPLISLLFDRRTSRDRLTGWTVTVVGAWYLTWLLGRVGALRLLDSPDTRYAGGAGWVMLMLLGTWACDTGAYVVGSRFGRHQMMPWISPNKTWEGAVGGAFATVLVVAAFSAGLLPEGAFGLSELTWRPLPIPLQHVVPLGVGLAVAAILGDLTESMIKRDAGAKDASGFFPGHGGVLDRVDSVLFAAPFTYYYASLLLGQVV
jgi:phosphatidate cytidylyltransferase